MAEKQVIVPLGLLRKVADYVGRVQPLLEKAGQVESESLKLAPEVVETLASHGLVSPHLKEAKAKAYASNPLEVLTDLRATAGLVKAESIGGPSGDTDLESSEENSDGAFARIVMEGGQGV